MLKGKKFLVGVGLVAGLLALSGCSSIEDGNAQLSSKEFVPAHVMKGTMLVGKVIMPTRRNVPDEWFIHLTQGENDYAIEVEEDFYNRVDTGITVCVKDRSVISLQSCEE